MSSRRYAVRLNRSEICSGSPPPTLVLVASGQGSAALRRSNANCCSTVTKPSGQVPAGPTNVPIRVTTALSAPTRATADAITARPSSSTVVASAAAPSDWSNSRRFAWSMPPPPDARLPLDRLDGSWDELLRQRLRRQRGQLGQQAVGDGSGV